MSGQSCSADTGWSQPVLWVSATVKPSWAEASLTSPEGYKGRLHYLDDTELVVWRGLSMEHVVISRLRMEVPPFRLPMPVTTIISFDETIAWPFIEVYFDKFLIELSQAITEAEAHCFTIDFAFGCWTRELTKPPLMVDNTIKGDRYAYRELSLPMNPEPAAIAAAITGWLHSTPDIEE